VDMGDWVGVPLLAMAGVLSVSHSRWNGSAVCVSSPSRVQTSAKG
jgi:hypothetical protein